MQWSTLSAAIDNGIASTQGDILYRGSSAWSALAPGTSGKLLATGGSGANPSWTGLASADIWVGNSGGIPTAVAVSGDVSLANTGAMTVKNIQGTAVASGMSPTSGQVLTWNNTNSNWDNESAASGGVTSIATNNGVTGGTITSTGTIGLATISANNLLANASGSTAAPSGTTLTALIDSAIGSTQGDILYRGSSTWAVLAPGTSGQYLKTGGASANPSWANGSGSTSPAGSSGQVQYNSSGSFGATSNFTYDSSNLWLTSINANTTNISALFGGVYNVVAMQNLAGGIDPNGGGVAIAGYYSQGGTAPSGLNAIPGARFDFIAQGPNGQQGLIDFATKSQNDNTTQPAIQMTIKQSGIVQMAAYGAGAATFDSSGNISSTSDERLKDIQGPLASGLEAIKGIVPIVYKWNKKSGMETKHEYSGFSAQNVRDNVPNGVGKTRDGYLTLQDRAIMATMVNAIKELSAEVDRLKVGVEKCK
jgi:hypothetical protein